MIHVLLEVLGECGVKVNWNRSDIAYTYIRVLDKNVDLNRVFCGKKIFFYGCNSISRLIYESIKENVEFLGFIDHGYKMKYDKYKNVPIYSLKTGMDELKNVLLENDNTEIVITIMWRYDDIMLDIRNTFSGVNVTTLTEKLLLSEYGMSFYSDNKDIHYLENIGHMTKSYQEVVSVITPYALLFYLLIKKDFTKSIFVFNSEVNVIIIDKIRKYGGLCVKPIYNQICNGDALLDFIKLITFYNRDISFWGQDHVKFVQYFLDNQITVLEDGVNNYFEAASEAYKFKLDNGRFYYPFGYDEAVNSIFLTGKLIVPESISNKVKQVNLMDLWQKKSIEDRQILLDIFSVPQEDIERCISEGRSCLLLTQNFSKIGVITQEEQIEMYKDILQNYEHKKVIIKPHPQDYIDYMEFFPECRVLEKSFPIEFVKFLGVNVKKVISVASSAIFGFFPDDMIDSYENMIDEYGLYKFKCSFEGKRLKV